MTMDRDFFTTNRRNLVRKLGGGVFVFAAFSKMQQGADEAALFEQEANFWWLTGVEFADWQLIIDGTRHKSWLVAPKISDINTVFDGSLSSDDAKRISGVDEVISDDAATMMLRALAKKHSVVYALGDHPYIQYFDFVLNPASKKLKDKLTRIFASVSDCRRELDGLRAIKQPVEIAAMRKAISLTIEGFELIKTKLPDLKHEYEAEAEFTYLFRRKGGGGHAFSPIIAGGNNATTVHYFANNDTLKKRDLLVMDVGARYHGYAADVARTYSIGQPTKRQLQIHEAVRSASRQIISLLKPNLSMRDFDEQSDVIMISALMQVGLMTDPDDKQTYRQYFPHAMSHGLGIDAHDGWGDATYFQPGMVLAVEPGIYIPAEGIGIRIEDNILITASGHENLSRKLSTDL